MSSESFAALASQGYNRVPVARTVLADLDTPLSVYLKLADAPFSYLFESVQGGERWGRYSIIGLPARTSTDRARARSHRDDRWKRG
jgi:anthranilate synthase component 1